MSIPNVVVFGEEGSGKSSLINQIVGADVAEVSAGVDICTLQCAFYKTIICGKRYNIIDTPGLNGGKESSIPHGEAAAQLFFLLKSLQHGVSLLILVVRGPRMKGLISQNWALVHEVLCQKKVPIVVAITGLEWEEDMDAWWPSNKATFRRYGVEPSGFACITAVKGKPTKSGGYRCESEYEESKGKVATMIRNHVLDTPWKMERIEWCRAVHVAAEETTWSGQTGKTILGPGMRALIDRCQMSEKEAGELVARIT